MAQFYGVSEYENPDRRKVIISSVDPENLLAVGVSRNNRATEISLRKTPGGTLVIPNVGEEWVIQSLWGSWTLHSRTEWHNTLFSATRRPGEMRIGGTTKLTIEAEQVTIKSSTSLEEDAVLASGVSGFVKYQTTPLGDVYCWGEVTIPSYSGTLVNRTACTLNNLSDPVITVRPTTRRMFNGAVATAGNGYPSTLMQVETDGRITYWTVPGQTISALYFSATWHVEQS